MIGLLLYFVMFYLLKVSSTRMAVCKTVRSDEEPEYHQKSFINIFIEKDNFKTVEKGNNETKGEQGEIGNKGEKSGVGQINQTEINQLKHKITGWVVLHLN